MQHRIPLHVPKFSRRTFSYFIAAAVLFFLALNVGSRRYSERVSRWTPSISIPALKSSKHPIDDLVAEADKTVRSLVKKKVSGVSAAAEGYRARRGRHPPPEFDKWVEFAEKSNALIIEDFFDNIYDDLEPFWSIPAKNIRKMAASWPNIISVRNRVVKINRSPATSKGRLQWRSEILKQIQHLLPDVDLAISVDEQQAIIVPWETINKAILKAGETRAVPLLQPDSVPFTSYSKLRELPYPTDKDKKAWKTLWNTTAAYWDMARSACPPDGPARSTPQDADFTKPPMFLDDIPDKSYFGFVHNWTESKSPCVHPELRNLHGSLVAPDVAKRHTALFPLFADSKIQDLNNVIVFPARYSWDSDDAGDTEPLETPWEEKQNQLVWRGYANGGLHNKLNWSRFHRHRFVAMSNSSWVSAVESKPAEDGAASEPPAMFPLPRNETWSLSAFQMVPSQLSQWVANIVDVGFSHFMCNPSSGLAGFTQPDNCDYVRPYYKIKSEIAMPDLTKWKFLADVDGDGSSGKFLKFLRSNSVPLKATILAEWHDKRLIPWKHFVPVDNTFADFWGIMQYFVGFDGGTEKKAAHDHVARAIAEEGQKWSKRVLRRDDVLLYVYRLILEYARVCDDRRDNMGYVKDIVI